VSKANWRITTISFTFILFISPTMASTSELPEFGDSSLTNYQGGTEQKITQILTRELKKTPLISDHLINYDIQRIAKKIAPHTFKNGQAFDIYIILDDDINAFAAPGGIIGINTGLLLAANSEDEVASVLAHEIAHQTQHHLARSMEQSSQLAIPTAAAALGSIALAVLSPQAGQAALTTTMAGYSQVQLNYTRGMEAEADHLGLKLLSAADYNVDAFAKFLEQLQNDERYNHGDHISAYLRTHPLPRDRISDVRQRANLYPKVASKAPLPYLLLKAKIDAQILPAHQIMAKYQAMADTKDINHQITWHYATCLALMRQNQLDTAASHIAYLQKHNTTNLYLVELYADYAIKTGHVDKGIPFYTRALQQQPHHYGLLLATLECLLEQKQARTALALIHRHHVYKTEDYMLLKAKIEAEAGFPAEAYMTQASFAKKHGNEPLAKKLVMAGLALPDQSQRTRDQLQAKLNELSSK
jgi:predicted Zn-dependent protease